MSTLSEAEITAAKSIAAALVGYPPRVIASAYERALNAMLGKLLTAGWSLEPASARAVAFADAFLRAVDQAKSKKAMH